MRSHDLNCDWPYMTDDFSCISSQDRWDWSYVGLSQCDRLRGRRSNTPLVLRPPHSALVVRSQGRTIWCDWESRQKKTHWQQGWDFFSCFLFKHWHFKFPFIVLASGFNWQGLVISSIRVSYQCFVHSEIHRTQCMIENSLKIIAYGLWKRSVSFLF